MGRTKTLIILVGKEKHVIATGEKRARGSRGLRPLTATLWTALIAQCSATINLGSFSLPPVIDSYPKDNNGGRKVTETREPPSSLSL